MIDFYKSIPFANNTVFFTILDTNIMRLKAIAQNQPYDLLIKGNQDIDENPKAYIEALTYPFGKKNQRKIKTKTGAIFHLKGLMVDISDPSWNRIMCADSTPYPHGQAFDLSLFEQLIKALWQDNICGASSLEGGYFGISSSIFKTNFCQHQQDHFCYNFFEHQQTQNGYEHNRSSQNTLLICKKYKNFFEYIKALLRGTLFDEPLTYMVNTLQYGATRIPTLLSNESTFLSDIGAKASVPLHLAISWVQQRWTLLLLIPIMTLGYCVPMVWLVSIMQRTEKR